MKSVYICAPLGGNVDYNISRAKLYARYTLLECGAAPFPPHCYAESLDDNVTEQRELGIRAAKSFIWACDELWVFSSQRTKGMREEIDWCKQINIPVKYIQDNQIEKFMRKLRKGKYNEKINKKQQA